MAKVDAPAPEFWIERWKKLNKKKNKMEWWLRIRHQKGKVVFQGQGYSRKIDMMSMVHNFAQAQVANEVEIRDVKK